ncbi:outer membrane beta-barrel protein [Chitinophaga sp. MM2321]|uniref:outer membrane beta-barrel protein n=1 Tax=Chitinophaga sp. MM2321 TaxID=3137178 RepID=UPI0032D5A9D4
MNKRIVVWPILVSLLFVWQFTYAQERSADTSQPELKQLQTIEISGSKPVIQKSDDKTTYNLTNSVSAAGTNILDAIGKIPGVRVNNGEISLVGKGAVKVMINNRLVQLSGNDLLRYLQSIAANQVLKVEVISNPSARYETEGNAGLVNIILKHDKQQGYSGSWQLASKLYAPGEPEVYGIQNFGELALNGNINYNKGRWSAYGSLNLTKDRHLEGFGIDMDYPDKTWKQTDTGLYKFNNLSLVAGVDYKLSNTATIGASYIGGKNNYDGSDHVLNPVYDKKGDMMEVMRTYADYYPIANSHAFNLHADILLDTTGKKLLLDADYFNYYRTDRSDFESNRYKADGSLFPDGRTRYYDDNVQHIDVYTLKADAVLPSPIAKFNVGAKLSFINTYSNAFYYDKADDNSLTLNKRLSNEFDYKENTQSVYGTAEKDFEKWKLMAGVRAEVTQTNGYSYTLQQKTPYNYLKIYPSLQIGFDPGEDHHFALMVNKRVNRPTFWNLNPFKSLTTAESYLEGNPYLQPAYTTNFELSHVFRGHFTTAVFANITSNGFTNVTLGHILSDTIITTPLNFLGTFRIGVSENIAWQPTDWWTSNQQVLIYHTSTRSSLANIREIAGYGAYLATNNDIYFNKKKTFAGTANFWYQFPEINQLGKSNAYYKLDLGVKASILQKKVEVALTANDLLRSSAVKVSSVVNDIPQTFYGFQINRFYQLSISYKFGNTAEKLRREAGNSEERKRL